LTGWAGCRRRTPRAILASGSAGSTSYAYNGDGLTASVADADGTTSYTYDGAGRLATLADPVTGTTATYSYNSDSLVSGISYGSGKDTRSFGYDGMRRLTSDTLKTSSGATVASLTYGYSPDSEITSETTTGLAGAASSIYTYDEAGRLASWNNGTTTTAYGYDSNGNLTQDGSKTYTYDARDELTSDATGTYAYTARGTPSSEPGPGGPLTVTFDAYGDQATAGTRSYAYDALGRLTADAPATGGAFQFSYAGSTGTIATDGTSGYAWNPAGTVLDGTGAPGGGSGGVLALTDSHGPYQSGQRKVPSRLRRAGPATQTLGDRARPVKRKRPTGLRSARAPWRRAGPGRGRTSGARRRRTSSRRARSPSAW